MTVRHYAFGNIGRDKDPKAGTQRIDREALGALRDAVPGEQTAVFLCEINEGDDNDELALVRKIFKGWTLYGSTTREPILLSPDQPRAMPNVLWVPETAVREWSPNRSWLTVNLSDEPTSLLAGHAPAGAHGQGDRPDWAKPLLNRGFDNFRAAKVNRIAHLHRRGRNVVSMTDENDYSMPPLHPREHTVWHDRTDYGRVTPAKGYHAEFHAGGQVDFRLDSHDGHTMHGTFKEAA